MTAVVLALRRAAALAVLLVIVLACGWPVWQRVAQDRVKLENQAQQLARYRALAAEVPVLRRQATTRAAQPAPASALLPSDSEAAAAALQAQLKRIMAGAHAVIISLQPLPMQAGAGYFRLPMRLQITADTAGLQRALYDIEAERPLLTVDKLNVRVQGGLVARPTGPADALDVTLEVSGFLPGGGS